MHAQAMPVPQSRAYHLGKRLLDGIVAALLLSAAAPLCALLLPWLLVTGRARIQAREFVGIAGKSIWLHDFGTKAPEGAGTGRLYACMQNLPRLFDLLDGRLSLVGPRPAAPEELQSFSGIAHPRFSVAPGLTCLWSLRRRSNIDFGTESEADLEYVSHRCLRGDIGILGRALLALAYGADAQDCGACQFIGGIRLLNLSMANLLDAVFCAIEGKARMRIAFVNPDCVNIAARDAAYRRTLDKFDWVCADGIGMKIAGSLLGRPIRQNINGTDMFPRLCAAMAQSGHSLYLLGARDGVAQAAAQWALARYPELKIAGTRSGYFSSVEEAAVLQEIRSSGAQVLLVAMGAPRQEQWLERNLEASGALVGMGVGGLFDFYSGRIRRAPLWLREIGGEWIYRLIQEPGRMWRRYLVGNWVFLARIVHERFSGSRMKGTAR